MINNISIIGASSFAKEVYSHILSDHYYRYDNMYSDLNINFYVDDRYLKKDQLVFGKPVHPISLIDKTSTVFVAVGDSLSRYKIVKSLDVPTIKFLTFIHTSCELLYSETIQVGKGTIICAGCIITCDVKIGDHVHLNLNTTVGHDTVIGDFFTSAPGVNISGNVNIGERVYMGTNSCVKEHIRICDDVTIGMGACVVKDIILPGTYVGIPAKLSETKNAIY